MILFVWFAGLSPSLARALISTIILFLIKIIKLVSNINSLIDNNKKNISEIIIAKQRNGPIGTVELAWLPEYTKFANLARD